MKSTLDYFQSKWKNIKDFFKPKKKPKEPVPVAAPIHPAAEIPEPPTQESSEKEVKAYLAPVALHVAKSEPIHECNEDHGHLVCCDETGLIYDQEEADELMEQILVYENRIAQLKAQNTELHFETVQIPVHVHIMHKGEEYGHNSNISDEQVYSAIREMNKHFSKEPGSGGDGAGPRIPFQFVMATKDDNGNPTNGISRTNGAARSAEFEQNGVRSSNGDPGVSDSEMKSWSRQSQYRVCNIWVVPEINGNNGGSGVQGYAYFPTNNPVDGIVMLYNAFGRRANVPTGTWPIINVKSYTSLGKVLTHEMGHYFALFHTFHNTTSCALETNPSLQGDRDPSTPSHTLNTNGNVRACGRQRVENYMDYTPEKFKNEFSTGQRDRMQLVLMNSRSVLLESDALDNLTAAGANLTMGINSPNEYITKGSDEILKVLITNISNKVLHTLKFLVTINGASEVIEYAGPIPAQGPYGYDIIGLKRLDTTQSIKVEISVVEINGMPSSITTERIIIVPSTPPMRVEMIKDNIAGQISWDFIRLSDNVTMYAEGPFANFEGGTYEEYEYAFPPGEYLWVCEDIQPGMTHPDAVIRLYDHENNLLKELKNGFSQESQQFEIPNLWGDLNDDGGINIIDVSTMSASFNSEVGDENYNPKADLNEDGKITILDFSILNSQFGQELPDNEPNTD